MEVEALFDVYFQHVDKLSDLFNKHISWRLVNTAIGPTYHAISNETLGASSIEAALMVPDELVGDFLSVFALNKWLRQDEYWEIFEFILQLRALSAREQRELHNNGFNKEFYFSDYDYAELGIAQWLIVLNDRLSGNGSFYPETVEFLIQNLNEAENQFPSEFNSLIRFFPAVIESEILSFSPQFVQNKISRHINNEVPSSDFEDLFRDLAVGEVLSLSSILWNMVTSLKIHGFKKI